MNLPTSGYENNLKQFKILFFIAAALFLTVATICVVRVKHQRLLETTLKELVRAQAGSAQVKEANTNRRQALAALQEQFDLNAPQNSPEMILYRKFEELKTRLNPDEMTMSAIEKNGKESSLKYTLEFNNLDYNTLLNTVGSLSSAIFPLITVSTIAVTQDGAKGSGGVSFKITGTIVTSEKTKP